MSVQNGPELTAPQGLGPAQMGVLLLGRVTLGHAAATVTDLAERGILRAAETGDGADSSWQFQRQTPRPRAAPLPFEEAFIKSLFHDSDKPMLSGLAERLGAIMHRFQKDLMADAVHHGWLRHLHHARLSYAVLFGLVSRDRLPPARLAAAWLQACAGLPDWQPVEAARPGFDDPDFTRDEWRGMGLGGAIVLASNQ